MEIIRNFSTISKNDADIAGGKGASLGEMTQAGISVPPGFVVLAEAFEKFLEETDLNVEIVSILHSVNHKEIHTVENASEKIQALILGAKMPKDIEKILKSQKKFLKEKFQVKTIGVFGSFARNEQSDDSDVDILVEFYEPIGWDFFDLQEYLEQSQKFTQLRKKLREYFMALAN